MAVCLVTGGAGFIGSHVTEALLKLGHEVRVLDNFCTGRPENLEAVRLDAKVYEADVTDVAAVHSIMRGVELVFHQAALASVPRSVADPLATHHACATGTLNILTAAKDAGVRRVVYAASSSAYGNSERLPKRESDPTNPLSPYAVAKLAGEHYCAAFNKVYGLQTVALRYFNVYGPRQSPDGPYAAVIPRFIQALVSGERPVIHGDGQQTRDFTFVADAVRANLRAAAAPAAAGNVYNIAGGKRISLLELVDRLNVLLGTQVQPLHTDPRPGDVRDSQADISRAATDLGFAPEVNLDEGLQRCLEYYGSLKAEKVAQ
jgi:UDP-glucose 4-epimerase